jgi:hypothetical protein
MNFIKNIKEKLTRKKILLLSQIKNDNIKKLNSVKEEINKEIDLAIKNYSIIVPTLKNRDEIINFKNTINDNVSKINLIKNEITNFFKDNKSKYNIVMLLKSGKIKAFEQYEDKNIDGFINASKYYTIDKNAIIEQKSTAYLFYFEDYSAPVNFKSITIIPDENSYNENNFQIELSSRTLRSIVEGKAFEGIMSLGKPQEGFSIDWKMALIGVAILVVGILQYTGTIDLTTMLALGK